MACGFWCQNYSCGNPSLKIFKFCLHNLKWMIMQCGTNFARPQEKIYNSVGPCARLDKFPNFYQPGIQWFFKLTLRSLPSLEVNFWSRILDNWFVIESYSLYNSADSFSWLMLGSSFYCIFWEYGLGSFVVVVFIGCYMCFMIVFHLGFICIGLIILY